MNEPLGPEQSMATVRDAIFAAGHAHGWKMKDVSDTSVMGTLDLRTHRAVVDIHYSTTEFSITYVDSENLDAKDGNIHRAYNRWVNNLRADIHNELASYDPE